MNFYVICISRKSVFSIFSSHAFVDLKKKRRIKYDKDMTKRSFPVDGFSATAENGLASLKCVKDIISTQFDWVQRLIIFLSFRLAVSAIHRRDINETAVLYSISNEIKSKDIHV